MRHTARWIRLAAVIAWPALGTACAGADAPTVDPPPPPPFVTGTTVSVNPDNVLSVLIDVGVAGADSAAVLYHAPAIAGDTVSRGPSVPVTEGAARIPVLGLWPASRYDLRVIAWGPGGPTLGDPATFDTGALPTDLPSFTAGGPDPSPGYVAFAAGSYGVAIDNAGRVVWYHRFPNGPGLSFQAEPTGDWATKPAPPSPGVTAQWIELDPLGNVVRSLACTGGLLSRPHDILVQPDSSFWILCDDVRTMNLSAIGGLASARVTGTAVQHVSADGRLLFGWTPFDHFALADLDAASLATSAVNWTHGNALDLDSDGNLIVSFRNLSEVVKIDVATGAVLWRLGGRHDSFLISGAAPPPFSGQHGARALGGGELLVLDNLGDPTASRAKRYHLDTVSMTARLERSLGSLPGVTTQIGGSVQGLPNGHTLVSFGTAGRVEEYDADGAVVWHIEGNAGYVFRAQRVASLYRPGAVWPH